MVSNLRIIWKQTGAGGAGVAQFVLTTSATHSITVDSDPLLETPSLHHIALVVDGGPPLIRFVVDGMSHDGGRDREFGWQFYNPALLMRNVEEGESALLPKKCSIGKGVRELRVYGRHLTTSELVANFRANVSTTV